MSSSDRIILLYGDGDFSIPNGISYRNQIAITNSVVLSSRRYDISPVAFRIESETDYKDLYVDFTTSGWLRFKIPSKNMLIRVNQSSLNLTEKVISGFEIRSNGINFNGNDSSGAARTLSASEFTEYSYGGIIRLLHCIPEHYYINEVSQITIATGNAAIPAGKLTIDFFQF